MTPNQAANLTGQSYYTILRKCREYGLGQKRIDDKRGTIHITPEELSLLRKTPMKKLKSEIILLPTIKVVELDLFVEDLLCDRMKL